MRSPSLLVTSVYPEHKWILHQFSTVPQRYWDNTIKPEIIHGLVRSEARFQQDGGLVQDHCKKTFQRMVAQDCLAKFNEISFIVGDLCVSRTQMGSFISFQKYHKDIGTILSIRDHSWIG